jgi:hypothetical protein
MNRRTLSTVAGAAALAVDPWLAWPALAGALEVGGMIAMLDFLAVEKRPKALRGGVDVVMNPGRNTATVRHANRWGAHIR